MTHKITMIREVLASMKASLFLLAVVAVAAVSGADHRLSRVLNVNNHKLESTEHDDEWIDFSPDELIDQDNNTAPEKDDDDQMDDEPEDDEPGPMDGPYSDEDLEETIKNENITDYVPQPSEAVVELVLSNNAFDVVKQPDTQKLIRYALSEDMGAETEKIGVSGVSHGFVAQNGDIVANGGDPVTILAVRLPQISAPDFMNLLLDDHGGEDSSLLGSSLNSKNITISGIRVSMGKIDREAIKKAMEDQMPPEDMDKEDSEEAEDHEDPEPPQTPEHSQMRATLQAAAPPKGTPPPAPAAPAPAPPAAQPAGLVATKPGKM